MSSDRERQEQLRAMLSADEQKQLMELCGRCLWHTLTEFAVAHGGGHLVHVPTGDIPDMWCACCTVDGNTYGLIAENTSMRCACGKANCSAGA